MAVAIEDEDLKRSLGLLYAEYWLREVREILFAPSGFGTRHALNDVYQLLLKRGIGLPDYLLPLCVVDESSLACVVIRAQAGLPAGVVIRLYLNNVNPVQQCAVLDIHPLAYVASVEEELAARDEGMERVLDVIGPAYERSHIDKGKRPRDYVIRPVRIACQNVIVALAAFAQDSSFDGLSVVAWQTCEVPHVATHEANRALAALTLCDAFQNGGTMEIRFDRQARLYVDGSQVVFRGHPEGMVPASLRRFGRTVGVLLGVEDPAAITPSEARQLFLAVTPMPPRLRARVDTAIRTCAITPERICFSLLSQVWREPEMDFILATSARARSILHGGAAWTDRASRQAESEVCRAAVMVGMLFRRLNSNDTAGDAETAVRVVEDRSNGVIWQVDETNGAVMFRGLDTSTSLPWTHGVSGVGEIIVFPRTALTNELVRAIAENNSRELKVILIPADAPQPPLPSGVVVLRCPERLADIDKDIEQRLLTSRISRG
jgi:hypothetical protein